MNLRRRRWLKSGAQLAAVGLALPWLSAHADPYTMRKRFEEIIEGAKVQRGRIRIDLPDVADNGHSVPMAVTVDTPSGHPSELARLFILSDQNPRPMIASFEMGPALGRSTVATRVRLNGTQRVTVLAQFSDGSWWVNDTWVEVSESACLDPTSAEVQ